MSDFRPNKFFVPKNIEDPECFIEKTKTDVIVTSESRDAKYWSPINNNNLKNGSYNLWLISILLAVPFMP